MRVLRLSLFALVWIFQAWPLYAQSAIVRPASPISLLGISDSNSPMHWNAQGRLVIFQSDGMPIRTEGPSLTEQGRVRAVRFYSYEHAPLWIEATWVSPEGTIYAWYHHEQFLHCDSLPLSQPVIGALRSDDDGLTFHDLGIVLSPGEDADCNAQNGYFGGGHGDFTVIADPKGEYLYFLFSNYSGPVERQGVAVARMAVADRDNPVGFVSKFANGGWESPGVGGEVSPVYAASRSWSEYDTDALWGPSVHWNTHLERFVIVMSHACCQPGWPQEGLYVAFAPELADPASWTQPVKLIDKVGWYPMVVGSTDKVAGQRARLFTGSISDWEIEFYP